MIYVGTLGSTFSNKQGCSKCLPEGCSGNTLPGRPFSSTTRLPGRPSCPDSSVGSLWVSRWNRKALYNRISQRTTAFYFSFAHAVPLSATLAWHWQLVDAIGIFMILDLSPIAVVVEFSWHLGKILQQHNILQYFEHYMTYFKI